MLNRPERKVLNTYFCEFRLRLSYALTGTRVVAIFEARLLAMASLSDDTLRKVTNLFQGDFTKYIKVLFHRFLSRSNKLQSNRSALLP